MKTLRMTKGHEFIVIPQKNPPLLTCAGCSSLGNPGAGDQPTGKVHQAGAPGSALMAPGDPVPGAISPCVGLCAGEGACFLLPEGRCSRPLPTSRMYECT